jgi:Na+/melibiose symporter-like transporter
MAEKPKKLLLYSYGIADLSFTLMINMEAYFFTAFLTDHAQFSLIIAGQILALTGLIDIVCSLVGGIILQKTNLRFGGKYRSWFLIGPPIVVPLFILQFTKIGNDLTAASIIIVGFIASHLLFNVVVSAGGAMVARIGRSSAERTVLSASRAQGMAAAGLIFSATAMPMIRFFSAQTNRVLGYTATVAAFAFLMMLGYWLIFKMTAGQDPYEERAETVNRSGQSVIEIVGLVFKNPPLLFLILASTFASTSFFIVTTLAIYFFTYVTLNPAFLSVFILAISIARLTGTLAATWIGIRIGKRKSYWIFLGLAAVGFASAKLMQETPWGFTLVFCVSILLASVASSMNTALFSDTVIYGEWKTGRDIRAFTMALMNLPIKVGVLLRSAIVTAGLMIIGFVANSDPSPSVADGIASIMTFTTAAGYAIAAAIFFFGYRIEEKQVLQMQEEIAARKEAVSLIGQ